MTALLDTDGLGAITAIDCAVKTWNKRERERERERERKRERERETERERERETVNTKRIPSLH